MVQLPLCWGAHGSHEAREATRCKARRHEVRLVEYQPFPRASAAQGMRVGFTRDLSTAGMCLEVDREQRVGSLLRLTLRSIDGRPTLEALARVAWCHPANGATLIGLAFVDGVEDAAPSAAQPQSPGPRPTRRGGLRLIA